MTTQNQEYVAVVGIDHDNGRNEPGDTYTGPESSLAWLIPQGLVKKAPKTKEGR